MAVPIDAVEVENFRSIVSTGRVDLGAITLLIGGNNAGKSAFLQALHMVQSGGRAARADIRIGAQRARVRMHLSEPLLTGIEAALKREQLGPPDVDTLTAFRDTEGNGTASVEWPTSTQRAARQVQILSHRPEHLTVPFFSRRKSTHYETEVRLDLAREVDVTDRNITSRIANLATGQHPAAVKYRELVDRVLGLEVATFLTADGQVPGQAVGPAQGIELTRMGEGVSSVVALMTELAHSGTRLFLIEEPENDLHPKSLLALLEVIREASEEGHQFVVTTHNDVVLRSLGSLPSTRIYRVERDEGADGLPISSYRAIEGALDREEVLLELGYEQTAPFGWLLLEEASGETFVRDVLVPLFVPRLSVLRTVSAGGAGNLPKRLNGLQSMFLFAHLGSESHRAWVLADGDDAGRWAIETLRTKFSTWPGDRFQVLPRGDIEDFYPERFADRVSAIRAEGDGRRAKVLKGALIQDVRAWSISDPGSAVGELGASAADLIDQLRFIEASIASS